MIRPATFEDYDELKRLVVSTLNMNGVHNVDETLLRRLFTRCVHSGFAYVADKDGFLKGLMLGLISPNLWGELCAQDLVCISTHDTHKLLRQYKKWAEENQVKNIIVTNTYGNERFDRLIKACGFSLASKTYNKEI